MTKFRPGDLIKIVKNDMSIVMKNSGPKDNKCFNKVGVVLRYQCYGLPGSKQWFAVSLPSGIYLAREDAAEAINEC